MAAVLLTTHEGFISSKIQRVTWSIWTHVAIRVGDDVYESEHRHGVRRLSFDDWADQNPIFEQHEVPGFSDDDVREILQGRLGNGYDWLGGVIAQLLLLKREHPHRDHCAELVGLAFRPLFNLRNDELHTLTPRRVCEVVHAYRLGWSRKR